MEGIEKEVEIFMVSYLTEDGCMEYGPYYYNKKDAEVWIAEEMTTPHWKKYQTHYNISTVKVYGHPLQSGEKLVPYMISVPCEHLHTNAVCGLCFPGFGRSGQALTPLGISETMRSYSEEELLAAGFRKVESGQAGVGLDEKKLSVFIDEKINQSILERKGCPATYLAKEICAKFTTPQGNVPSAQEIRAVMNANTEDGIRISENIHEFLKKRAGL